MLELMDLATELGKILFGWRMRGSSSNSSAKYSNQHGLGTSEPRISLFLPRYIDREAQTVCTATQPKELPNPCGRLTFKPTAELTEPIVTPPRRDTDDNGDEWKISTRW
ncbi:uncharacterized protein LOC117224865 [Megalopta genalis]|uniref:uncharacterized protein LOC117224865 n=1 Tax=Megalopta genalis TaxID=115081 RepID=UPI003FD4893C